MKAEKALGSAEIRYFDNAGVCIYEYVLALYVAMHDLVVVLCGIEDAVYVDECHRNSYMSSIFINPGRIFYHSIQTLINLATNKV